ncbi:M56 family metallopeptidase [Flavihumibacter petaseus]|uniref:Peptidase M56 family protein n=1 Tax=Flavihumibacter petaseus NBRC 106054 TaxID=1220578 RepID=A0A0E9N0Q1_9BACT|nr:M56 family metallopeptidase [Flavihumibacter petaseus]GAO42930.1 peptidase M56 family protein [Flavihumibacter petaseus NBRC 106054]
MHILLTYLLKLSISLAAVYLFYWLLLRRLTFYRWNRYYLLGYAAACFFLPLLNIYQWLDQNDSNNAVLLQLPRVDQITEGAVQLESWTAGTWLVTAFIAGVIVMLGRMAVQYVSLFRLRSRAVLLATDNLRIYEVQQPIIPFSFGSSVFINTSRHQEAELKEIIKHEMVHVRERHTIDMVFAELLVALNWYNPFAWLLRHAIRQNLEFIADEGVLAHGIDRRQYQYLLLKVVGQQQFSMANHLNISALKNRINMMNTIRSARVHLVKFAFVLPVIAVLLLAFRREPQKNTTKENQAPAIVTLTVADTLPQHRMPPPNEKGYILTIADNIGECVVIIKDRQGKLIRALTLEDWNKDSNAFESQYGKIPPPPPAPVPPTPPGAPAPVVVLDGVRNDKYVVVPDQPAQPAQPAGLAAPVQEVRIAPVPPRPPRPAKAPKLPANVSMIIIKDNSTATVTLKNGKKENYDLSKPDQRAQFEKKYGRIEAPEPVELAEPVVSITANAPTTPLYIIDGKEADAATVRALDPHSIDRIEVFKDAEAAKTYGEKGKNGVIKLTTKTIN